MWLHLLAQNPSELAADELLELVRATSKFVASDLVAAIERVAPGGGSHAVEFLGVDSHHTDVRASHSFIAARWDAEDPVTSTPLRTLIFGVVLLKRHIRSLVATLNAVQARAPSAPPLKLGKCNRSAFCKCIKHGKHGKHGKHSAVCTASCKCSKCSENSGSAVCTAGKS